MVRIAYVKHNQKDEYTKYLCPDKKIKNGDVVYVEDDDTPYFIENIEEVATSSNIYKKVVSKAIYNENVITTSRYMNIIDCPASCIVNSLGVHTYKFGNICKAVVDNAKSKEIEDMLKNHPHGNIFETFITDAGNLPSEHIIHIVMPYKNYDLDNSQLRKAIDTVIKLAISRGYPSLAIPFVGTGANGYEKEDVSSALLDVMFKYQYTPNIKINIISVNYNSVKDRRRLELRDDVMEIKEYISQDLSEFAVEDQMMYLGLPPGKNLNAEVCESNTSFSDNYNDESYVKTHLILTVNKLILENYKYEDELPLDRFEFSKPIDFIDIYRRKYTKVKTIRVNESFGYQKCGYEKAYNSAMKRIRAGRRKLQKEEAFRLLKNLKCNFTQCIQFLTLYGFTFSPVSDSNLDYSFFYFILVNDGFDENHKEEEFFRKECDKKVFDIMIGDENLVFAKAK